MTHNKKALAKEQIVFSEWLNGNLSVVPSEQTLKNYSKFLRTLVITYELDMRKPNPFEVIELINARDLAPLTKKMYKTVLKQYLKFKGLEITDELTLALKYQAGQPRKKLTPKDLITETELRDILEHTQSPMLRAYYAVLWDTSARPSALTRLDVQNVTEDNHGFVLHITKAKTQESKRSIRLLTPLAIQHFSVWWSIHPRRTDPEAPLFINRYKNRVNVIPLRTGLTRYHNKRLGRGNNTGKASLSLYLFRKSRLTQLTKEGKLSEVQIKLRAGHKKHSQILNQSYLIIDQMDQSNAELEYLGVSEKDTEKESMIVCPNCSVANEAGSSICFRCKFPLTEQAMIEQQAQAQQVNADNLKKQIAEAVQAALAEALKAKD